MAILPCPNAIDLCFDSNMSLLPPERRGYAKCRGSGRAGGRWLALRASILSDRCYSRRRSFIVRFFVLLEVHRRAYDNVLLLLLLVL